MSAAAPAPERQARGQRGRPRGFKVPAESVARAIATRYALEHCTITPFRQDKSAVEHVIRCAGGDTGMAWSLVINRATVTRWRLGGCIPVYRLETIAHELGWSTIGLRWFLGWRP